jgi:hypothetical protein
MKVHYRRSLLCHRISVIDSNKKYKVDLLQALHFLHRAWDSVKVETIERRCFRKAGFVIDNEIINILPEVEEQDEDLNNLWETLKEKGETEGELADYLSGSRTRHIWRSDDR